MQFLRTVFWFIVAVVGVAFALTNSQKVEIHLWSDILVETPLWFVVMIAFLLGLLPTLILHRATRWTLRRKLDAAHRSLSEITAPALSTPPPAPTTVITPTNPSTQP